MLLTALPHTHGPARRGTLDDMWRLAMQRAHGRRQPMMAPRLAPRVYQGFALWTLARAVHEGFPRPTQNLERALSVYERLALRTPAPVVHKGLPLWTLACAVDEDGPHST